MKGFVARRVLWTVFAVYIVLSAAFFALAVTPDPNAQLAGMGAGMAAAQDGEDPSEAASDAIAAYEEARNRDRPLLDRYADWIIGYATLNWGWSFMFNEPVTDVLADATVNTFKYLIPGVLLASLLSVLAGLYGALYRNSFLDRLSRGAMFLGLALPAFVMAFSFKEWGPQWLTGDIVGPAIIVGVNLFAVQAWIVRSETKQLVPEEFVKTLRASGAGNPTVASHVLRNAASPLLAMFVSEVLVVLYVTVFIIEIVLGIQGLGLVGYMGFEQRDIGIVLAIVMLPAIIGLTSNLVKDVLSAKLDPRVST